MIADRCEINRQIRADNKMLRELKAKVAKLAEAVEKSVPIIAETLEAIRNHMIFTQYHLPVSYTHLDVYKRQGKWRTYIMCNCIPQSLLVINHSPHLSVVICYVALVFLGRIRARSAHSLFNRSPN